MVSGKRTAAGAVWRRRLHRLRLENRSYRHKPCLAAMAMASRPRSALALYPPQLLQLVLAFLIVTAAAASLSLGEAPLQSVEHNDSKILEGEVVMTMGESAAVRCLAATYVHERSTTIAKLRDCCYSAGQARLALRAVGGKQKSQ